MASQWAESEMSQDEPLLTEREAVEKMRDALALAAPRREVMSVAAWGLEWRNRRMRELEHMVVRLGGWPWGGPPPKGQTRLRKRKRR